MAALVGNSARRHRMPAEEARRESVGWRWRRRGRLGAVALLAAVLLPGCELEEITVVEVEDVVVAEVLVQVERSFSAQGPASRVQAFLHRTVGGAGPGYHEVPGARVIVRRADGFSVELAPASLNNCAGTTPVEGTGSCYLADGEVAARFSPGDELELEITLRDGGVIYGASRIPGDFALENVADGTFCTQPADTPLEIRWGRAEGAWAYVNETSIRGLSAVPALQGVEVDDPLYLLGLSVSAADTTIVFPGEFGVFNRFELDRAVALTLQEGLPSGSWGDVSVAAVDRNYVQWARGGNFNPSGQVRVPSLRGDGTGLFGSVVVRRFGIAAADAAEVLPPQAVSCIP